MIDINICILMNFVGCVLYGQISFPSSSDVLIKFHQHSLAQNTILRYLRQAVKLYINQFYLFFIFNRWMVAGDAAAA